MSCLDNTTAAGFVEGALEGVKAAEVEAHIDGCAECRALLGGLAQAALEVTGLRETLPAERGQLLDRIAGETPARGGPAAPAEPGEGSTLSRYVILRRVGSGGMGIVYAAFDPQLDRKVAIKLLHPSRSRREDSGAARTRLLREAQAMARLAHPNTIVVHDVGTFGDQVFVAMEFIDGGTLREWLTSASRSWREIRDVFLRAGRGLAAAHAARIVHRDFKPDNVLVGKDGRVVVTDFGLARADVAAGAPPSTESGDGEEDSLTRTGAVVGTPAYMPPEQIDGREVDARGDQFSFCVALWEALHGKRPFAGRGMEEIGAAIKARKIEEPAAGRVAPAWLRRVIERGLSPVADERYASMEAVLSALARDPAASRRRWLAAGAVVAAMTAAIVGARVSGRADSQVCKGAEKKLAGVWDGDRRQAVSAAFTATKHPRADATFTGVAAALDGYAADWSAMHLSACEATRVSGEQSAEVLDLRMACLEQRRLSIGALTDVLATIDVKGVDKALLAARSLPSLRGCADVAALKARVPPPSDPVLRQKVDDLRKDLVAVKVLVDFGEFAKAQAQAEPAAARGRELKYRPMEAEALYLLGRVQDALGKRKEAEDTFLEGVWAAEAGHEDGLAVQILAYLSYVAGNEDHRFADAEHDLRLAEALFERRGPDLELEAHLANARGNLAGAQERYDESYAGHKRATELWEKLLGADHPRLAISYANLGVDARHLGKLDEALAYTERAGHIWETTYGPDYPLLAGIEMALGSLYSHMDRFDDALVHDKKALALAEKAYGPEHPEVASALHNLGILLDDYDKDDEALVYYQRALELRRKIEGPDSIGVAGELNDIGNIRQKQGRFAEALPLHEQALAGYEKTYGDKSPRLSVVLNNIGSAQSNLGHPEKALPFEERALALFDQKFGGAKDLADIQLMTATVLVAMGRDRERALGLARDAIANYEKGGKRDAPEAARARAWLEKQTAAR